jgi:hypothetical protein
MDVLSHAINRLTVDDDVIREEESPYIKHCLLKYKCWVIFVLAITLCFSIATVLLATIIQSESFSNLVMYIMESQKQRTVIEDLFKNSTMPNIAS